MTDEKASDAKILADTLDCMADLYMDSCAAEIRTFRAAASHLRGIDGLRSHLAGIETIANKSRSQTRRIQLIAARCRSALNGDNEWRKLPMPRKSHPVATTADAKQDNDERVMLVMPTFMRREQ